MTKKVALIGHPVSHSLSPKLHNYWIKQYGIDAEYEAIDVLPEDLESTIKRLQDEGYVGCNITHPYKEKAVKIDGIVCSVIECALANINTVILQDKIAGMLGLNTDYHGFSFCVRTSGVRRPKKVLIFGGGAVAKTIILELLFSGCEVLQCSRDAVKGQAFVYWLSEVFPPIDEGGRFKSFPFGAWQKLLCEVDYVINATVCGMEGYPELDIDLSTLKKDAVVFDVIYNPKETGLLKQARERGHKTINGLDMFLYQAQASFEILFGIKPEITQELRDYMEGGEKD